MLGDGIVHLFGRDIEVGSRIGMDDRIGERDGRAIDILAADVEGPGDRIERGQDGGIRAGLHQPVGDRLSLVGGAAPGKAILMHHQPRGAGRGAVGPDRVDRVGVDRDQCRTLLRQRGARRLHPGACVQPGVIADPAAAGGMDAQPIGDRGLRHAFIGPMRPVHLLAHLQCVAAVGEDRRLFRQHHRAARRPLKPRQPGKPLRIGADIFAHMFVGQRHDEAVEPVPHQLRAQRLQPVFIGGHSCFLVYRPLRRPQRRQHKQAKALMPAPPTRSYMDTE